MCASVRLAATAAAEPRASVTWQCIPSACSGGRSCLSVCNLMQVDMVPCRGMALPYHTHAMAGAACTRVHTLITDTSLRRRQRAEITVYTLRNGVVRAEDEEDSLYAAIDLVSDKVGRPHGIHAGASAAVRGCCAVAAMQTVYWRAGQAAAAEDEGEGDQPGQVAGQRRAQGRAQHQGGPGDRQRAGRVGGAHWVDANAAAMPCWLCSVCCATRTPAC